MSMHQMLFASYANPLIVVDSADFDGTNDFMTTGAALDGVSDSKSGILSLWVRLDGGTGLQFIYSNATTVGGTTPRFNLARAMSSGVFNITGRNSAGTSILVIDTVNTFAAGATWLHILSSWNLAAAAAHLYINDVSDLAVTTLTDDTIVYSAADNSIGATPGGTVKLDGCLAEVYFAPGQFLDFSNVYQRRKFISASGKPVYLGATGALPTGTAPAVYQSVADGAAVATFATNLGTGGDFSITGTLATGSTSPSD